MAKRTITLRLDAAAVETLVKARAALSKPVRGKDDVTRALRRAGQHEALGDACAVIADAVLDAVRAKRRLSSPPATKTKGG